MSARPSKAWCPGACVSQLAALGTRGELQRIGGRFVCHLKALSSVQILWCLRRERFTISFFPKDEHRAGSTTPIQHQGELLGDLGPFFPWKFSVWRESPMRSS